MTISYSQLQTDRATAGAAYAAAAQAYVDAWVELAAYDGAVTNKNAGGNALAAGHSTTQPQVVVHPDYLSQAAAQAMTSPPHLSPVISARIGVLVTSVTG